MIAANLGFKRAIEKYLRKRNASLDDLAANGGLRAFSARQFLLPVNGDGGNTKLVRGSTLVDPAPEIDENRAAELARGIGRWMLRNLSADGELSYKYWPSRGVDSPADNAIRRFLASLSLARLREHYGDAEIRAAARRNLRFNLARYFRNIGDGRGAIVERTGAKLGAAALAALCILESPTPDEFMNELAMLTAGVNSLADDEVGFRTFFFPPQRDGENWNFYSGEALLFWAEATRRGALGAPSLERCAATFARCRERHLGARNPAFVPWHAQACASLYTQTGRREFADFVFEISDWLLPMQQWDRLAPDLRGRFYDPRRPEFGPPHAASTGAYLEGLADALTLARTLGDGVRADAYQRAIDRGLRSLRAMGLPPSATDDTNRDRGPSELESVSNRWYVHSSITVNRPSSNLRTSHRADGGQRSAGGDADASSFRVARLHRLHDGDPKTRKRRRDQRLPDGRTTCISTRSRLRPRPSWPAGA